MVVGPRGRLSSSDLLYVDPKRKVDRMPACIWLPRSGYVGGISNGVSRVSDLVVSRTDLRGNAT